MRKSTLTALAVFCFALASNAQISKGSLFLGGSVYYSKTNDQATPTLPSFPAQESTNKSWGIRPQIGTAVATNQIVGLFLNFSKNSSEQKGGTISSLNENNFNGGGIFYRRYYPLSSRFYLFGDAAAGLNFGKTTYTSDNGTVRYTASKSNATNASLAITPGLSYAASRKLFLEAAFNDLFSFAYSSSKSTSYDSRGNVTQTGKSTATSIGANANGFSGLSIGLRWILPKKK